MYADNTAAHYPDDDVLVDAISDLMVWHVSGNAETTDPAAIAQTERLIKSIIAQCAKDMLEPK